MAKERLSKLQKWILIDCYDNKNVEKHIRADILEFFYGWKNTRLDYMNRPHFDKNIIGVKEYNKKQVIVSRALKRLIEKGLLERELKSGRKGLTFFKITKKGLEKGKSLMLNKVRKSQNLTIRDKNKN